MPVFDGVNELDAIYDGTNEIAAVYDGTEEIWSNVKAISLGSGTSFNVSNISGFESFTANNFFVKTSAHPSVSDSVTGVRPYGINGGVSLYLNKSYNSSTGVFSFNLQAITSTSGVSSTVGGEAYLIPKLTKGLNSGKVVNLGSGTSWNIANIFPDLYKAFTINNFFVQSATTCQTGAKYYEGTFSYAGYGTLSLSYNASTGILSGSNSITMTNTGGGYISNNSASILPFLIVKGVS